MKGGGGDIVVSVRVIELARNCFVEILGNGNLKKFAHEETCLLTKKVNSWNLEFFYVQYPGWRSTRTGYERRKAGLLRHKVYGKN